MSARVVVSHSNGILQNFKKINSFYSHLSVTKVPQADNLKT